MHKRVDVYGSPYVKSFFLDDYQGPDHLRLQLFQHLLQYIIRNFRTMRKNYQGCYLPLYTPSVLDIIILGGYPWD